MPREEGDLHQEDVCSLGNSLGPEPPIGCQYVGMTLRQMSFYPLTRHASPCVPQRVWPCHP